MDKRHPQNLLDRLRAEARELGDADTGEASRDSVPGDMRDALVALKDAAFLQHPTYQKQQWRANRDGAHLLILDFEKAFIKRCAELGIPMFAPTVVRTRTMQKVVFRQGLSLTDGEGDYAHQHCAADIVHSKFAWNITRDQWKLLGHIGKEVAKVRGIAIVWGGDWRKPYDPAHWELAQWRERAKEVLR